MVDLLRTLLSFAVLSQTATGLVVGIGFPSLPYDTHAHDTGGGIVRGTNGDPGDLTEKIQRKKAKIKKLLVDTAKGTAGGVSDKDGAVIEAGQGGQDLTEKIRMFFSVLQADPDHHRPWSVESRTVGPGTS